MQPISQFSVGKTWTWASFRFTHCASVCSLGGHVSHDPDLDLTAKDVLGLFRLVRDAFTGTELTFWLPGDRKTTSSSYNSSSNGWVLKTAEINRKQVVFRHVAPRVMPRSNGLSKKELSAREAIACKAIYSNFFFFGGGGGWAVKRMRARVWENKWDYSCKERLKLK